MYTKVFRQMYEGTLADSWQALVTFQQLLVLADEAGVVDMTVAAIHRTTGIPMEILTDGIEILEKPDHGSRTPDMEGRRIARLDEHRDWGWFLVNFKKYRQMVSKEEKKEADRERINTKRHAENPKENIDVADCRDLSQGVAECSEVSPTVADVAHAEAEAERAKAKSPPLPPEGGTKPTSLFSEDASCDVVLDAYHAVLPNCLRIEVLTPKRIRRIQIADKLARQLCRKKGWTYNRAEFWRSYFEECLDDPWLRGETPNPRNARWKQNLDVLIAEDRFADIMDKAIASMSADKAA